MRKNLKFNEIGSNFSIDKLPVVEENNKLNKDVIYLDSGRNAIRLILKNIKVNSKNAVLPAFTCKTVIQPFIEENYNLYYYDINEDFSININSFKNLILEKKPSIIFVHSYFGKDTLKCIRPYLRELKNKRNTYY